MKKFLALIMVAILATATFTGCSLTMSNGESSKVNSSGGTAETTTLKVAALESAYGSDMWKEVAAAFEKANAGVKIELTVDKNLEDVIGAQMKSGNYPDVIHLAVGRPAGLTETMTKENAIRDLSTMLNSKIPGEEKTVKEKIIPGFADTLVTNPYKDGKTYLSPMFYGPCGLFYNANLFKEKGWEVPTTFEEMWTLGDKAKKDGIALFTYPTTGYFDSTFYALLNEIGGAELFNKCMTYTDGIWESAEATKAFEIIGKLAGYTEQTTIANANNENYLKNQQLVLDNKAIFMPNGTWVAGEMKDAKAAKGFEWGFMALPALEKGGDRYSYTYLEQMWSPKECKNPKLADKFMAFLYSDEAAAIFAKAGAVQPIEGVSSKLEAESKAFYSVYDNGAKVAMGAFASTDPVEGVNISDTLFGTINSIVSGDKTVAEWQKAVEGASDALRAALK